MLMQDRLADIEQSKSAPPAADPVFRAPYTRQPFPKMRNFMIDASRQARKRNLIYFAFEADVTRARRRMQQYKAQAGHSLSFSVFVLYCLCKAIEEDKRMHAMRKGKGQLVLFDDVDATVIIEKAVEGILQPVYYIVRQVNRKAFLEIQREVRWAADAPFEAMCPRLDRLFFTKVPRPLRDLTYWSHRRWPRLMKFFHGTTCITSVGMFGSGSLYMTPLIGMTSSLSVGGINTTWRPVDGALEKRELLSLVLSLDHDIVDGAHATRFITRLKALMDQGCGLPVEKEPG